MKFVGLAAILEFIEHPYSISGRRYRCVPLLPLTSMVRPHIGDVRNRVSTSSTVEKAVADGNGVSAKALMNSSPTSQTLSRSA